MPNTYISYCVANSIRDLSNTMPTPPRTANCCIDACRRPYLQSSRDLRDELLVKKISARDSSKTFVAPPTAEYAIAYSTNYCRFTSFKRCAIKRFETYFTVARALDIVVAKPLPCDITAPVHESCAKKLSTAVVCTRDFAASCVASLTEHYSALKLASTCFVSCTHRVVCKNTLVTTAQVDTRATSRDACEYNSDHTPQSNHLILNLPSSLLYRRRISRLILHYHLLTMSSQLDCIDAAKIFSAASVDAISMEDARRQLQSHIAIDVIIEGLDQPLTDSITSEGCATPRLFLERTLARLPLTLGGVYCAAMIACDTTPVCCEKQSPEGTLFVARVFCFRIRSYYAARQVFAMLNRRFDSRPIAKRLSICYLRIPHKLSVAPAAAAAQSATEISSLQAPQHTTTQQSQLSRSSAGS